MSQSSTVLRRSGSVRAAAVFATLVLSGAAAAQTPPATLKLVNGRWFDGQAFRAATMYVAGEFFVGTAPDQIDAEIDLEGGWVIPPLAESHTHTIVGNAARNEEFLHLGIFYAKVQAAAIEGMREHRKAFSSWRDVDLIFAAGAFTAPDAHPEQIGHYFLEPDEIDGNWVHLVETPADVEAAWPSVLTSDTNFIKTFLLYSNEYEQRRVDDSITPRHRGMNPALLADIVERAHAAGLKVSCHVRTADDFHRALLAGVDEIAHMPGFSMGPEEQSQFQTAWMLAEFDEPERFKISRDDARLAAERGVIVDTTIGYYTEPPEDLLAQMPEAIVALVRKSIDVRADVARHNLALLRKHGVTVALGSDSGEGNVIQEATYIQWLGVLDRPTLLRMLCVTTPRTIFPNRKIGRLADGYEASFLVLGSDPVADIVNVSDIRRSFKRGRELTFEDAASD
ncbi:MAG: amidohydrolase family protein [Phycisphaerales bacterium]